MTTNTEPTLIKSNAELNALVAGKIFDWVGFTFDGEYVYGFPPLDSMEREVPDYSRDMNAAMEVAKRLQLDICCVGDMVEVCIGHPVDLLAVHQKAAIAVCIGALKTKGVEIVLDSSGME